MTMSSRDYLQKELAEKAEQATADLRKSQFEGFHWDGCFLVDSGNGEIRREITSARSDELGPNFRSFRIYTIQNGRRFTSFEAAKMAQEELIRLTSPNGKP